jgi:hypothetical protein
MIYHQLPSNWQDLQNKVAEIFADMGFATEVEKHIETVRGGVNIDVYAIDKTHSPELIYLCECKHWGNPVPQMVVQAFRTVVQDYGANIGFIISEKGFQKGAFENVKNTNITLINWNEFQNTFEDKWLKGISIKLSNQFRMLIKYTDYLLDSSIIERLKQMTESENELFNKLALKYLPIGIQLLALKTGVQYPNLADIRERLKLPVNVQLPTEKANEMKTIVINSLKEYMNYLQLHGNEGLSEFDKLFKNRVED